MAGLSSPPSTPRSRWRAGWWHVVFLVLDLPVGLVAVGVAVLVVTGVSTLPLAFVGALILVPTLWFAELFGWAERVRLEAFLGIRIEAPAAVTHPTSWRRLLLDRTRWRATAYASICALWATFIGAVVMSVLGACLPLLATPFLPSMAPPGGIRILPWLTVPLGTGTWLLAATAGLVLAVAPLVAGRLTCVDVALARWLLGPDTRDQIAALATRVDTLTEDRAATVDSVEEERRRIERDLHDGPQQRLVSIAMDLGMAREWLDEDPARAKVLLDSAHSASKEAITEIRNVARGIAPPVLTDRGLDAAISALAARTSVPVTVDIEGVGRLDPTTEAIAYFCVSECLTNVVKHADAAAVTVRLRQQGADLVVRVSDNGRGGADPAGGTGLTGLRQRVRAVDGSLTVDSPPGGPTVVTASLPHRIRRPS